MSSPVWFITGVSAGLGQALAKCVAAKQIHVVGTVRNQTRSTEAVSSLKKLGVHIIELDVTNSSSNLQTAVEEVKKVYGRIDVLVNNAGYSLLGAVEDMSDGETDLQFATNFYGPLRLIRAVLPGMRAQKQGTIVNVSSIAGQDGLAACGMYAASKFALEGLSESLSKEVAPFNIKVLIVEPGAFRTKFLSSIVLNKNGLSNPYKDGPVQETLDKFKEMDGTQAGDPEKAAQRIFETVTAEGVAGSQKRPVLRLPLGSDCFSRVEAKLESVQADLKAAKESTKRTDYVIDSAEDRRA